MNYLYRANFMRSSFCHLNDTTNEKKKMEFENYWILILKIFSQLIIHVSNRAESE